MFIATVIFWLGRHKFIAIPAVGWTQFKHDALSPKGRKALINLSGIYLFIAVFWSLYDQTGSSWVLQAEKMDRHVTLGSYTFELLASQIQAINPILIMAFIPIFTYVVYPALDRVWKLTSLRKINFGFFLTALSFAITAVAQHLIDGGATPSILWQVVAFVVLTAAEVMISITALEFSYTQAPLSMKSLIMGLFYLSVSLGNGITALVNVFMQTAAGEGTLEGASYYWFFTGFMVAGALLFFLVARLYKEESYIQSRTKPAAL
jgi:POT family proton-dependent oligopeptide transporter